MGGWGALAQVLHGERMRLEYNKVKGEADNSNQLIAMYNQLNPTAPQVPLETVDPRSFDMAGANGGPTPRAST